MRSRRLVERTELLHEVIRQFPPVHRDGPAGEGQVQVLSHLDLELTAVEYGRHRRVTAIEGVGDSGAAGSGSAGRRLTRPPLEDPGPDAPRPEFREPGDIGPVGKQLMV